MEFQGRGDFSGAMIHQVIDSSLPGDIWWCLPQECGYGSIPIKIPFLGEWTSINPSYFDVNYRGTIGFDTLPCWKNGSALESLQEKSILGRSLGISRSMQEICTSFARPHVINMFIQLSRKGGVMLWQTRPSLPESLPTGSHCFEAAWCVEVFMQEEEIEKLKQQAGSDMTWLWLGSQHLAVIGFQARKSLDHMPVFVCIQNTWKHSQDAISELGWFAADWASSRKIADTYATLCCVRPRIVEPKKPAA